MRLHEQTFKLINNGAFKIHICNFCGRGFYGTNDRAAYCGDSCKTKAYLHRRSNDCLIEPQQQEYKNLNNNFKNDNDMKELMELQERLTDAKILNVRLEERNSRLSDDMNAIKIKLENQSNAGTKLIEIQAQNNSLIADKTSLQQELKKTKDEHDSYVLKQKVDAEAKAKSDAEIKAKTDTTKQVKTDVSIKIDPKTTDAIKNKPKTVLEILGGW